MLAIFCIYVKGEISPYNIESKFGLVSSNKLYLEKK